MRLDGAHAQVQLPGDLGVGVAERDQAQHRDLALGQVVGRPGRLRRLGGEPRPEPRVEVGVALGGEPHGLEQLVVGRLLEDEAERAVAQRLAGERRVVLHGEHDDRGLRRGRAQLGDRVEAGAARHVEVEHQHARPVRLRHPDGGRDVAGLGHDLQAGLRVEQQPQPAAHDRVVVGDHHRRRLAHRRQLAARRDAPHREIPPSRTAGNHGGGLRRPAVGARPPPGDPRGMPTFFAHETWFTDGSFPLDWGFAGERLTLAFLAIAVVLTLAVRRSPGCGRAPTCRSSARWRRGCRSRSGSTSPCRCSACSRWASTSRPRWTSSRTWPGSRWARRWRWS